MKGVEKTMSAQTTEQVKKRVANVVLLGCGGVGAHLLQRILATRALHASTGLHVAVVAVSDSKGMVLSKEELDDSALKDIMSAKAKNVSLSQWRSSDIEALFQYKATAGYESTLQVLQTWNKPTVVVDCTASEETGELLGQAAVQGFCVVLANKKPITATLDLYDRITSAGRCFRCESTVGAGLPIMAALSRTLSAGDPIHRIVGALSGTLGYVVSGLQDDRLYSEVVATAKALGYTEPDPRDDLSGMDVARKALIIARAIGWRLNMEDVEVMSLYPPEMGPLQMSVEEFLAGLPSIDTWMRGKFQAAQERRSVLRYVATIENNKCKVRFTEVSPDSPLGRLRGSDNLVCICRALLDVMHRDFYGTRSGTLTDFVDIIGDQVTIYTDCYKMAPLVIQGAGAGNDTTAAGVLADIIDLQDLYKP